MKSPQILAFDVFGTVVDWYGSIHREVSAMCPGVDADAFVLAWRAGYKPAMARVTAGELGWTTVDDLHLMILRELLERFEVRGLSEEQIRHLNTAWHRLDPWPDSVLGMNQLKRRFMLCSLSNGNIGLLANMAKHAGLPWDCILSAEVFGKYKPHPDVYLGAARVFRVEPQDIMMVAAHQQDLAAARACGLATAFVRRPQEYGPNRVPDSHDDGLNTVRVGSLIELADLLAV